MGMRPVAVHHLFAAMIFIDYINNYMNNDYINKSSNPNLRALLNLSLGNEMVKAVILINK